MKSRYMPILYAGMVLAAFAAGFHSLDRISRSLSRNPSKVQVTSGSSAEVSETTLSDIRKSLEKQEYHISYDAQRKKLQSPNRNNNIRAYYEPGKLTVQTRVDTTGEGFKMELVNEGIFADGKLLYKPEADAQANHHENKVQISHDAFTEEFINNEDGVRQNFIVENAPEGTRQLQVKMSAKGLKVEQGSGNELRFYSQKASGQPRNELVYSDLKCWDANKKPLNATLAYVDNHIRISVDVAGAAYPVTIDPIIANGTPLNSNQVLQIHQFYMWLGFSVASAGDVNGDGYSDVIVGAPQYDLGEENEGGAFVYKGAAYGLSLTAVTFQSNQKDAKMGYSVSSAGDFNGDGFSDVIVGIPFFDGSQTDQGLAKIYLGSGTFFTSAIAGYSFAHANRANAYNGISVATAGDVDGDGFSDILIGASQDSNGHSKEGTVTVSYGNSSGDPEFRKDPLEFNQPNAQFGYSVAPAGDVDADGFSDIIIGARYYTNGQGQDAEGAAFIYRGGANGLQGNPTIIEGNQYNAAMGNKVSSAGDVNGDGYSDILISAWLYDDQGTLDAGRVGLYLGSNSGINTQAARYFTGKTTDERMGSSIACAGDVNGDGYSDILIGAQHWDNGQFNEGGVFVYHGSKDGIPAASTPASTLESNQNDGWFGTAISSAGDVNGDGYSDILIGCYTYDDGQKDEGLVFVYHGGAEGIGTKDAVTLTGSALGGKMGYSVASAGDVNSDGFDDIIVGVPGFDSNGEQDRGIAILYFGSVNGIDPANELILNNNQANSYFGHSVAGAGDINGDGYGDVIVGAPSYTNGNSNEGVAFTYYGSSGGLVSAPAQLLEININEVSFGEAVSGAGDVNRDGYSDVIVGASNYSNGQSHEGAAYVYYGSQNGLVNPTTLEPNQMTCYFGEKVSAAGDVNGDGYNDIIIGAVNYTNIQGQEGAAFVYHGSSQGIIANNPTILQSNQDQAFLGTSVSGAGDVNGDGFADIIVGAPGYDSGQSDEGVAIIYYGTASGVTEISPAPTKLEQNVVNAGFGVSVKSAGDVNGDGYSDVVIGAGQYYLPGYETVKGKAFVYHGSPNGIKQTHSFSVEGNHDGANLGFAVSGAGDVNGDGYSDIIIGAPHANSPLVANTGNATVYYGNNGKGLRNNVSLFNTNTLTPISYAQFSQPDFLAGLYAKSFIGRNKGRLFWETMSPGVPFSKAGAAPNISITNSTAYTSSFPNWVVLNTNSMPGGLVTKTGIATKVRVRVKYSPVLAITGQMYGPWRYLQSQLAGYNNAPVPEEAMTETIKRKADPGIETSVSLFPNPVSDRLSVQVADPADIRGVRLYNTHGTPVYQSQRYEKDIDVSKLPGGIYILTLNRASGTPTSHRIVIRR